jgi:outer membrane protein TolC
LRAADARSRVANGRTKEIDMSFTGCRSGTVALAMATAIVTAFPAAASADHELSPGAKHRRPQTAPAADDPFTGAAVLEREALVRAVLDRNPTVDAARAAWRAAEAKPAQAGSLDDPMLGYSIAPLSVGASDVSFGQVVDLSQRFPFPGKRSLRASAAEAEARAMRDDYESARRDVALMASTLFDDYVAAVRALEIKDDLERLLDGLMKSAQASYAAGGGQQYSLIRIELEKTHVEHDRIMLASEREVIEARINALLHRAPTAQLPPPPPGQELFGGDEVEIPALQSRALERAEVDAADARIDAAEASAGVARREYLPDFGAGATYNTMWDDPEHRLMVGLSLNLPLQLGRRKAAVDQAEAEIIQRRGERAALVDRLAADVEAAHHKFVAAHHIVGLYDARLLPAASDRVRSARAAFETGESDLEMLIETERELRDAKISYVNAVAERNRRYAELQRTIGDMPSADADGQQSDDRHGGANTEPQR